MQIEAIETETATEARADVVLCGRALRDAVKLLTNKLVERRQTVPALAAILFDIAPDGTATLTATDCDTWASVNLTATGDSCDTLEPGRFAVNGDALHKILSKAGKLDRVRMIDTGAGRVTVKASRSQWNVPTVKADDFPLAPISTYRPECGGTVDRAQFLADLAAMSPAMQAEETRYYLHGVALQVREFGGRDRFAMAATDGYMMAAASRPIPAGCEAWGDAIMHRKAVAFALAADKLAGAGDMTLSRSGTFLALEFGALRIVSKLVDGTYPDWPRAFVAMAAPTEGEGQGALFPDLLPDWPLARTDALQKAAPGLIDWRGGMGGVMGECATDPDMAWCAMYLVQHNSARLAEPVPGFSYRKDAEAVEVEVAGDRAYPVAINGNGSKIHLSKAQVAALCGDDLWEVLEFPGADGKPRYVSKWLWDDGDSRLLCVGKDGRCPKADAPREYVTRAEVEAALAGETASARQKPEDCAEAAPMPADTAEAPACAPAPLSCQPAADAPPIAAERGKRSDAERRAILRAWQMRAAMRQMRADASPEPEPVPAEIMADIAEAERLIRCEGYVAPTPTAIQAETAPSIPPVAQFRRTPAHERAIRRAWAERKAARAARFNVQLFRDTAANNSRAVAFQRERAEAAEAERDKAMAAYNASGEERRALVKDRDDWQGRAQRAEDAQRLAEQQAAEALAMREDLQRLLAAIEARLAAAEAENAQLWAEIETLTAPQPALAA